MTNKSGPPEADGLIDEKSRCEPVTDEGVKALSNYVNIQAENIKLDREYKSIRKRGYHRALKRQELWAIMEQLRKDHINKLISAMYDDSNCRDNEIYGLNFSFLNGKQYD